MIQIEHDQYGIWYFTSKNKAANFIQTIPIYFNNCLAQGRKCKGWTINEVDTEAGPIISNMIDPKGTYLTN